MGQIVSELERTGKLPALDKSADLMGPDANGNGVRDDIESYIGSLSYSVPQKSSLLGLSKNISAALLVDLNNSTAVREASLLVVKSNRCVWNQFQGGVDEPRILGTKIQGLTLNTKIRTMKWIEFDSKLGGSVFPPIEGDPCQ